MRILLSCIGSRGDVQPLLALALELQALGHQARICVAPNFQSWVESFGVSFHPIGPDLEKWTRSRAEAQKSSQQLSRGQRRNLARLTAADQFSVLAQAAQECDLIVVSGVLQTAGRSVAEALKIPYVYAAYSPSTLPSPDHPPATTGAPYPQSLPALTNRLLWMANEWSFDSIFRDPVNEQRSALGLMPVRNTSRHILTDHPWLAADPVLAPAGSPIAMEVTQTGAWLLPDPAALPDDVETFLADGEPPLYFGFGSMRAWEQTSQVMVEAARALGRRAIISQGWAQLNVFDSGTDCISVGDVNFTKLFPRVAAVVHHGGAGTVTAAALAGRPQVIVPQFYDQYYWAHRVRALGIGTSVRGAASMTVGTLVKALRECLKPEVPARALALASRVDLNGARFAAERLSEAFG